MGGGIVKLLNALSLVFLVGTVTFIHLPSIIHIVIVFVGTSVAITLLNSIAKQLRPRGLDVPRFRYGVALAHGLLLVATVVASAYYYLSVDTLASSYGPPPAISYVMGGLIILAILEASRLAFGGAFPIVVLVTIFYVWKGTLFPGILYHPGLSLSRIIEWLTNSFQGVYGNIPMLIVQVVMMYLVFGALSQAFGLGELLNYLASFVGRWVQSGTAQTAVFSSALFGMISGSAIANVATTGVFTIPLMKRAGFNVNTAGAIESVASSLGQVLPPVMGTAAFLMAEMLGVPYAKIVAVNVLPSLLLVLSVAIAVHLEGVKQGVVNLQVGDQATPWYALFRLMPVVVLIYQIMAGYSLGTAAYNATLLVIAIWLVEKAAQVLRRPTRGWLFAVSKTSAAQFYDSISSTMPSVASLALAGAVVGMLIQLLSMPVTIQRIAAALVQIGGGSLFFTLVLVAILCLALGMGVPTVGAYVITVVLFAPALGRMGLDPLIAHMFVLYYASLSAITPPVAVAVWTAVAISGGDFWGTGLKACYLAAAMFALPFLFVYQPFLVLSPFSANGLGTYAVTLIGFAAFSMAVVGIAFRKLAVWERVFVTVCGLVMISPAGNWSYAALGVALLWLFVSFLRGRAGVSVAQT